ncbi:MAG TPA: hypothetical protein DDW65_13805 [Firmicutes bacterium]|jgi:nitrogenase molybdenum-iron protein alpha chain|nr:hypothetical protein [Bacillota bacterium]
MNPQGSVPGFMQCATCFAPAVAGILATIEDTVVIIHSPTGCAASFGDINRQYRKKFPKGNGILPNARLVNTNLVESDLVCGIDDKLEKAIEESIRRF